MQIKDIYDGDRLIVGPYDWSWCTNLARLITKPDEYFRKVSSLLCFYACITVGHVSL